MKVSWYIGLKRRNDYCSKNTVTVLIPEETGTLAFAAAAALAAAVADALKTVWGTRRGISGTSLRPSAAHSAQLPAP